MCNSCKRPCAEMVSQFIPKGYDYKEVKLKCGSTSIQGDELRCETCSKIKPWYICKHGRDVSEYDCGLCEVDDD